MSLVNDMLRDLNRRTPVSNQAARVHGAIQSSIESKRPRIRLGLFVGGALLAGLLGGYLYFASMGAQVVPVPMAVVPTQPVPVQPAAQQEVIQQNNTNAQSAAESTVAPTTAPITVDTPAIENVVEIRELALQPNGFTLLIEASETTTFDVRDRSAYGLTLHIDGADRYDRSGTTVPGMSLLLVSDGLDIGIELEEAADFLVREDVETPAFDILITVSYRPLDVSDIEIPGVQEQAEEAPAVTATPSLPPPSLDESTPFSSEAALPSGQRSSPGRVNRELSLADRDRNNSQAALMQVQGGRMAEALQTLQDFLEEYPAAHQSRETLAKLLLAQQESVQAGVIVDQGLEQVPNYGPFKKIKARLLMQANDPAQALALLRSVPPSVDTDTEYHELLASLYQQSNNHTQAVSTYQSLLRVDRQQGRWWTGLGISLEAQDMDSDALASFQAALQTGNLDASLRQYVQNRIGNLSRQQ